MLTQLLSLVVLTGLTATTLLLCCEKWGWLQAWEVKRPLWLMKRCDLCAGYWLCVVLLLLVGMACLQLAHLQLWAETENIFWSLPVYTRLLLHMPLPVSWGGLLLALPLALPAAAVCRVLFGLSTGR